MKAALAAAKGDRATARLASQCGIPTSRVTAWKKRLMALLAELFFDGWQRRADQVADEQELHEQIGLARSSWDDEPLGESPENLALTRESDRLCIERPFLRSYADGCQAENSAGKCYTLYRHGRPHQALGYRTPSEVYAER